MWICVDTKVLIWFLVRKAIICRYVQIFWVFAFYQLTWCFNFSLFLKKSWYPDTRTQLKPRMPAVPASQVYHWKRLYLKTYWYYSMLQFLHLKLAAMCKRHSSFFPWKNKTFLHVVVYICLDGKGMAAALSMWRASFSFNAMCIMQ